MRFLPRLPAAALAAAFFVSASLPQTLLAQAPTITATKTDGTPAATRKAPGATVTYTTVISNTGTTAATGMSFTDPDVTGAAVQNGTLKVSPVAFDDVYGLTVAANTSIDTNTASEFSVTANDYVGVNNGAAATITISAFDAASVNGGTVTMVTSGTDMGKFTYAPAPAFTGTDSFTYTVTNSAGMSATGTVSLTVSGPVVWYVNGTTGSDGSTGKGTLDSPFASINKAGSVDAAGHKIYVATGTYNGTDLTMQANEVLIGQGAVGGPFDTVVLGITPSPDTPARPTIGGTKPTVTRLVNGNTITLAENTAIYGVTVSNSGGGYAVTGTNINVAQIGNQAISDVTLSSSGTSLGALFLSGGNGNVRVDASITSSAGRSVTVQNRTGSSVAFTNAITDTGTGISLTSNTGTTIAFSGGISLTTTTNNAFTATGGGTVTAAQNNTSIVNSITTTSGAGLTVQNTTIGAANLTFRSINCGAGANNGITLDTTGTNGGLIVTGQSTSSGSGGTITGKTGTDGVATSGIGVYLNNTSNVSLSNMSIQGCQNYGIRGNSVTGLLLNNCTVGNTTANGTSNTTDADATGYAGEGSIRFFNLAGTATITGCTLDQGFGKTVAVVNNTGTLTSLTVNNCTVRNALTASTASDALYFQTTGASTVANLIVNGGSLFNSHRQNAIQTNAQTGSRMDISISGSCVFRNTNTSAVSATNLMVFNGTGINTFVTFDINGNTFAQGDGTNPAPTSAGRCLTAGMVNGRGTFYGKIRNNTFGVSGVARSGAGNAADCLGLFANGGNGSNGGSRYLVQNNTVQNYGQAGIQIGAVGVGADINASIDATVLGNTIRQPGPAAQGAFAAVWAYAGNLTGDTNVVNLVLGSAGTAGDKNTMVDSDPSNLTDVFIGNVGVSTAPVNIYRNGSGSGSVTGATEAQVNTVIVADNNAGLNLSGNTISPMNLVDGVPSLPPLMLAPGGVESPAAPAPAASATVVQPGLVPVAAALPGQVQSAPTETNAAALAPQAPTTPGLTTAELNSLTSLAIEHWTASGLTSEQHALLRGLAFEVTNLPDMRLGEAAGSTIRVDADAGGNGWYVGSSDAPFDTVSSPTRLYTSPTAAPAGKVDLLTTLMHEMGHALGLPDTYSLRDRNSIMYGHLTKGERRYPAKGEAAGAVPSDDTASRFLTAPISIGVLPPGKTVTIVYDVVINDPPVAGTLSSQGTVSGSNFANVLTDDLVTAGDPLLPGAADPTLTQIDLPDVTVAVSPGSVAEDGGTALTYTFTRQGGTSAALTVNFALTGTALVTNSDFAVGQPVGSTFNAGNSTGTVVIPIGQASAAMTITPTLDTVVEPDETVIATVTSGTAYDVGTPSTATGTIVNDDTAVALDALPDTSLFEDQTNNFSYTFRRTGVTTGTTVASFSVGGTATFGTDYTQSGATTFTATTGSVTFGPGEVTKVVTLDPTADNLVESSETIILTVTSGSGYNVGSTPTQTATIVDDDVTVTVGAAPVPASSLEDSGTGMVYTFTRSGGSTANALTVNVTVSGTAGFTGDYTASGFTSNNGAGAATLTFSAGSATKTVTITPTTDTSLEPDETVILTVAANGSPSLTGGYAVGSPSVSTGTITNDDFPAVSVSTTATAGDNDAAEGGVNNGLFTFTRDSTVGALTVNFQLDASSTAVAGTDFTLSGAASFSNATGAGTVTFANGVGTATVTLTALTESPNGAEAAETARLNVVPSVGVYVAGASSNATVTILANSFLVTGTADSGTGSLRQAVDNANTITGTDTITFDPTFFATARVITLTSGELSLTSDLTIQGTGASLLTVSGGGTSRMFNASSGTSTLRGLRLTGGNGAGASTGNGAGGAIYLQFASMTLRDCVVTGNTATQSGGGIFASDPGGALTLVNCTVSGNTASGSGGGGLWLFGSGSMTHRIVSSTISGNTANGIGGGVGIVGTNTTFINSTISGNGAGVHGGGISMDGGGVGVLLLSSTTVTGNRCDVNPDATVGKGGGIALNGTNTETLNNTIVAGNLTGASPSVTASDIDSVSTAQTINTANNNLIGNAGTAAGITNGTSGNIVGNAGSGTLAIASILNTTLADNGGPTQTHALAAGSPAVNAGSNAQLPVDTFDLDGDSNTAEVIDVDQRGATFVRVLGTLDIGSFEVQKSVTISADLASKAEGNSGTTNFTFTVTRSGSTTGAVSMSYAVSGAAVSGVDFIGDALPSGTATIADAATTTTITIPVKGDTLVEANEAFTVTISAPDNGYVVSGATATSTITDDDTATVTVAKTTDGTESGTSAVFTLTQTALSSTDTVVNIATTGASTATSGTDFTAVGATATILAGQTTATVTIPITDDRLVEGPESIVLNLGSFGSHDADITFGATVTATASVTDNDTATLGFTATTGSAAESVGTQNVSTTLTISSTGTGTIGLASSLTADLTATGGTATGGGTDYTLPASPAVTFAAGTYATGTATQNGAVSVADDRLVEGNETAQFGLNIVSGIGTQVTVGGNTSHTLTINDNETVVLGYTSATGAASEAVGTQAVNVTLTISSTGTGTIGLASNLTANLTSTGGTATGGGVDYTLPGSPALTFLAGTYATGSASQNGSVAILDDRLVEGPETAGLGLSIVTNIGTQGSIGGNTTHTLTITDNDTATLGFTSGTGTVLEGQAATVSTTLTLNTSGTTAANTAGLAASLTADLTTTGGTATGSGTDYTLPSTPAVTFAAGTYASGTGTQNATVSTVDDRLGENSEVANLGLSIAGNIGTQVTIAGTTAYALTFTDNDIVSIGFTAGTGTAAESVGTQNVSMTLTLVMVGSGPIGLATDVSATLNSTGGPGTAVSGTDYTLPASPAVTFTAGTYASGTATQNAAVTIADDRQVEGSETAVFGVTSTWGITGPTMTHTLTITDNDTATLGFTATTGTAAESVGTQNVGATLTLNTTGTGTIGLASILTANFTTTGGTATDSGTDYTLPASPALTFPAGTYSSGISMQAPAVTITDDRLVEGSETAVLGLSIVTNIGTQVSIGGNTSHTLTITDNETATLGFTSGTSTALESAGTQSIGTTLTITSTGTGTIGLASSLTANFTTTGGTASGSDYTLPASPALTYAAGSYASGTATQSASVSIVDDAIVEANETAILGLSIVTNIGTQGSIGGTTGHTLTITDNDTSVITLSPSNLSQNEGTGGGTTTFTFTATASKAVQGGFTIAYSTADGTALAGSDYTAASGTLTFTGTAGESHTFNVGVTQDSNNELDETFTAQLGAFSGTTLGGSLSTAGSPATGTILNDDLVSLSIAATDNSADENAAGTGTWRITRNGVIGSTTVKLQVDATSTAVAADWTQSGATFSSLAPGSVGTAVIPAGVSFVDITLTPSADIHAEAAETAILKITTDAAYVIGTASATVTIEANDFVVINANDAGEGTLRQAVLNANAYASDDIITFATPQAVVLTTGELTVQSNGTLTIVDTAGTSISGNHTSRVFNVVGAQLTLRGLWIKDGSSSTPGGAITNAGTLYIVSSTLSGNATTGVQVNGGAIYSAGGLSVFNSTISGNSATGAGGAIYGTGVSGVNNSTISGNAAGTTGGGIYNSGSNFLVANSTITANTAASGGGGLYRNSGTLSLFNSIFAANTSTTGAPDVFAATVLDDRNNLVGVNTGHSMTNGVNGDIVGTAATPANALLGPLANNGGPTLTHMLQDGSPAINAGTSTVMPTDFFDLDGDSDTGEPLPVDQRGVGFPRIIGTVVDMGAYEAFAFRPAISATTVDEDTLSSTGLVVTPNTADGGQTTAFKITNIQNGTLYKNDGTTVITAGTFITLPEGAAGLKFKGSLNLNSPTTTFGFDAQATVDGADTGLRTGLATASITVTPVNDAPTVVSPGLADQTMTVGDNRSVPLPAAFTDVDGDTLTYTVFNNSNSAKATATINGNNVDLHAVAAGVTNITIQADDGHTGTVTDVFQVAVGTVNPTPSPLPPPPGPGGYPITGQTGTYNFNTTITNTTAFPINGFRVTVDYSAYLAAYPSLRLFNSTSAPGVHPAFIDFPFPLAVGESIPFRLDFYTATRTFPNPFAPVITVTAIPVSQPSTAAPGPGVPATIRVNAGGQILLEWTSTPGQWYEIRYSDNMTEWYTSTVPVRAAANKTQWIDSGAPFTRAMPGAQRFYIVNPRAAPVP